MRVGPDNGKTHAVALEEDRLVRQLRHRRSVGTVDAKSGLRLVRHARPVSNHLGCFTVRHFAALRRFRAETHPWAHAPSRWACGQDR